MVKRGDVYQSSFAFSVEKEDWEEKGGGKPKRIIRSIKKVYANQSTRVIRIKW